MMRQARPIDGGGGFHSKVIRTQCVVQVRLMYNIIASVAGRYQCEAFERRQGVVVKNLLPDPPTIHLLTLRRTHRRCCRLAGLAEAYLISS